MQENIGNSYIDLVKILNYQKFSELVINLQLILPKIFNSDSANLILIDKNSENKGYIFQIKDQSEISKFEIQKIELQTNIFTEISPIICENEKNFCSEIYPFIRKIFNFNIILELSYKNEPFLYDSQLGHEREFLQILSKIIQKSELKINSFLAIIYNIFAKFQKQQLRNSFNKIKQNSKAQIVQNQNEKISTELGEIEQKVQAVLSKKLENEKILEKQHENISELNTELRKNTEKFENLKSEVNQANSEKAVKLKFLATVLLYNQLDAYKSKGIKLKYAFYTWKNNTNFTKLIDAEIIKISEMNRNHKNKRIFASSRIISRIFEENKKRLIKTAVNFIKRKFAIIRKTPYKTPSK